MRKSRQPIQPCRPVVGRQARLEFDYRKLVGKQVLHGLEAVLGGQKKLDKVGTLTVLLSFTGAPWFTHFQNTSGAC